MCEMGRCSAPTGREEHRGARPQRKYSEIWGGKEKIRKRASIYARECNG